MVSRKRVPGEGEGGQVQAALLPQFPYGRLQRCLPRVDAATWEFPLPAEAIEDQQQVPATPDRDQGRGHRSVVGHTGDVLGGQERGQRVSRLLIQGQDSIHASMVTP
jgi:hypothetical protein